jgi:hypothetical protein
MNNPNPLRKLALSFKKSNANQKKKIIKDLSKIVVHPFYKQLSNGSFSPSFLQQTNDPEWMKKLNEDHAKEIIDHECQLILKEDLIGKSEKINTAMIEWLNKLRNHGVVHLHDYNEEGPGKKDITHPEYYVLVFMPHKNAIRCGLDYGRDPVIDFDHPNDFKFTLDENEKNMRETYLGKDNRHNHVRLGAIKKSHLMPPPGNRKLLKEHINYKIYDPE